MPAIRGVGGQQLLWVSIYNKDGRTRILISELYDREVRSETTLHNAHLLELNFAIHISWYWSISLDTSCGRVTLYSKLIRDKLSRELTPLRVRLIVYQQ